MSTALAVQADVTVVGYTISKRVELESKDFTLRMTPAKAYELAAAILTVVGEICSSVNDAPGMYDEPDQGLWFG